MKQALANIRDMLAIQIATIRADYREGQIPDAPARYAILQLECADAVLSHNVDADDLASAQRSVARAAQEMPSMQWTLLLSVMNVSFEELDAAGSGGNDYVLPTTHPAQPANLEDTQPILFASNRQTLMFV